SSYLECNTYLYPTTASSEENRIIIETSDTFWRGAAMKTIIEKLAAEFPTDEFPSVEGSLKEKGKALVRKLTEEKANFVFSEPKKLPTSPSFEIHSGALPKIQALWYATIIARHLSYDEGLRVVIRSDKKDTYIIQILGRAESTLKSVHEILSTL